jgi:lipooligosaccharide transport system permease protein
MSTSSAVSGVESAARRNRFRALKVLEWQLLAYRRLWRSSLLTSFLQPMMYVAGMGLGVGALVNRHAASTAALGGVRYVTFLAPGLLATTTMMVAAAESMWPILSGLRRQRQFHAMVATPLGPGDIIVGQAIYIALRCLISGAAVAAALMIFPATRSGGLAVGVLFAVLCGLAFGMPLTAFSATRDRDSGFPAMQRFVITPLFLFGGAFYPLQQLPHAVQVVAKILPLWHGVELCRGAALGHLPLAPTLGHVAYLLAWLTAGLIVSIRLFARALLR